MLVFGIVFGEWGDGDWWMTIGIIGIIGTVIFGVMFYVYAAKDWNQFIIEKYTPEIIKSTTKVYIEYDFTEHGFDYKGEKMFDSKEDYDAITDSTTQFYIIKGINHYGQVFEARLGFGKIEDDLYNGGGGDIIETTKYIEDKYDYNGNSGITLYNK